MPVAVDYVNEEREREKEMIVGCIVDCLAIAVVNLIQLRMIVSLPKQMNGELKLGGSD